MAEDFGMQIELAVKEIEKKHGTGTIMKMTDAPKNVPVIKTGSIKINDALGTMGVPKGRIIEIYGPEAGGKTTLATSIMIEAQKAMPNKSVAIVDAEHAFDPDYAEKMGLDLDRCYITQPVIGNDALEIVKRLIDTRGFSVIVIDSTAALSPKEEFESNEVDTSRPGLQGKMLSQMLRNCAGPAHNTETTIIFISQLRANISPMSRKKYVQTGGNGIKYYASQRISMTPIEKINKSSNSKFHGIRVKVAIDKNKVAPPHKQCEVVIYYGHGICREVDVLSYGIDMGLIEQRGAFYEIEGTKYRGQDNAIIALMKNQEFCDKVEEQVALVNERERKKRFYEEEDAEEQ